MTFSSHARTLHAAALVAITASCAGSDGLVQNPPTSLGTGPRIEWDLGHRPLPEIPIPNDVATWRDDSSPTGLRINASMLAPTRLESAFRAQFDELDGWGVYQAITIPFAAGDELDLGNVVRRHQKDDFGFADDAIYLVDLGPNDPSILDPDPRYGHPGLPMPIDLGEGNFQFVRRAREELFPNDPRADQTNIIFETIDEDTNGDGRLQASEDTNFDGVLGRPSVFPAGSDPSRNLTGYWDASSRTLIVRPVLPLLENHRYAVVVTDRLVGVDGQPVRGPFDGIAHPAQLESLSALHDYLPAHSDVYGNLRWDRVPNDTPGASHVAFAWRFTTQTTVSEWSAVREGIYDRGPFRHLAAITPRVNPVNLALGSCSPERRMRPYVIPHDPNSPEGDPLRAFAELLWNFSDPGAVGRTAQLESFRDVAYLTMGTYHTPFLSSSNPNDINPHAHWQINPRTGTTHHVSDAEIPYILVVPRERPGRMQPFPVAVVLHGYGGEMVDVLSSAGVLAHNGVATLMVDGPTHGLGLNPQQMSLVRTLSRPSCTYGIANTIFAFNRARDLNGNGIPDPAGDFWVAYIAHSRDNLRQYALDVSQLIRGVREWDGALHSSVDLDSSGSTDNDVAGDFDGNGRPDIGADSRFYAFGGSLGGIMSMIMGSAEPLIRGTVPVSGGGALLDIAVRTSQGGIREAVYLRMMGPLVLGIPASQYAPSDGGSCSSQTDCGPSATCAGATGGMMNGTCHATRTACAPGQISMRLMVTDVTSIGELEFACANLDAPCAPGDAHCSVSLHEGDDILVHNATNGGVRCSRVGPGGRFRVGIPSDTNDRLRVIVRPALVDPATGLRLSATSDFGTCDEDPAYSALAARGGAAVSSGTIIEHFDVVEGDCTRGCGHVPTDGLIECTPSNPDACNTGFVPGYFRVRSDARGAALVTPAEGLGLRRQSPEFRRFLGIAQALADKGDPMSFARYYSELPLPGLAQPAERHSVLVVNTTGDQNVPVNGGNAFSRAAGIVPFLDASAPPHLRNWATPNAMRAAHEGLTPNRVMIDRGVYEGVFWFNRWPARMDPGALFDVDDLDEGALGFGEQNLTPPLRLLRHARTPTSDSELSAVWAPTLVSGWQPAPDQPVLATLNLYILAHGEHDIGGGPRPDFNWNFPEYSFNLWGRFFTTDGTDAYYRSHPTTHQCLANSSCPHLQ